MEGKKGGFSLSSAVSAKRGGEQQGFATAYPSQLEGTDGGARMKAEAPRQQNQSRPQSNAPVNLCACPGK